MEFYTDLLESVPSIEADFRGRAEVRIELSGALQRSRLRRWHGSGLYCGVESQCVLYVLCGSRDLG